MQSQFSKYYVFSIPHFNYFYTMELDKICLLTSWIGIFIHHSKYMERKSKHYSSDQKTVDPHILKHKRTATVMMVSIY